MAPEEKNAKSRSYVSVFFECCSVYTRVYKNKAGDAYVGWCPRCAKQVRLKVGPGGTDTRVFRAR